MHNYLIFASSLEVIPTHGDAVLGELHNPVSNVQHASHNVPLRNRMTQTQNQAADSYKAALDGLVGRAAESNPALLGWNAVVLDLLR